jgi:hypothetical protein
MNESAGQEGVWLTVGFGLVAFKNSEIIKDRRSLTVGSFTAV